MIVNIDSLTNEKVKMAVKLSNSSKARRENRLFFLEGLRLCKDATLTGVHIEWLFFTENFSIKNPDEIKYLVTKAKNSFQVSNAVASKLANTENHQGIFCVAEMFSQFDEDCIELNEKYIALDNIQDPSNLGAICRTAEALGIKGAVCENCCDIYNPKAQRAAMGSLLRLPVIRTENMPNLLLKLKNQGMKVYSTTPDSNANKITKTNMSGGVLAVIGNEGNGVSEKVASVCDKITIPMLGRAESLNASMAAAITMWEMMRE